MLRDKEVLFEKLREILPTIQRQDFKDSHHKQEVEKELSNTILQLDEMGEAVAVRTVIFESNTGRLNKKFSPQVVDHLEVTKSIAGFVEGPDGQKISVVGDLLGRTYSEDHQTGTVAITEYFRSDGKDQNLLRVARRHNGLSGLEGAVTTTIPRQQAERLLFSGVTSPDHVPQNN